jgi:flagellar hook-associated protein 2
MISFGGLASGLDSSAIISAMLGVERLPLLQLEQQKETENAKLDLISTLKDHLKGLQGLADGLKSVGSFLDFNVTASVENVATFVANGEAQSGAHTLEVLSLAQADRWAFDGVADPDADLAGADGEQVDFTVNGTNYSIALTQAGSSLNEIAGSINDLAGSDVTASVVNVGTESTPSYQLVLAADETGEDYRITGLSSSVAGLAIDGTAPDGSGASQSANNITVGSNAVAIIDGLQIERSGNEFNNVVQGIDITVLSADVGTEISFSAEADTEAIKEKMQKFVDAYNNVINFSNAQNTYSEEGGAGGELFGDSILRSVRSSISSALFNVDLTTVSNDTEGFSTLSLVGIKSSSDGTLSIDDTVFDAKVSTNLDALADLFADTDGFDNGGAADGTPEAYVDTTADSGLAEKLSRAIDLMFGNISGPTGSVKALFDAREEAIDTKIGTLNDSIESKERYLEVFEQNLITRFAALEDLMGGLNAQGAALTNMLG